MYVYCGIVFSHEKGGNPAICNITDLEDITLRERTRERQILYDTTYTWNVKKPDS